MNECNLRLLPPFEINGCRAFDLSLPCIQVLILVWLLTGRAWFVHLAPPCKDFSVAKSSTSVSDASRSFVLFSCLVMSVCLQCGIGFTLESPKGSAMWRDPLMSLYVNHCYICRIDMDY